MAAITAQAAFHLVSKTPLGGDDVYIGHQSQLASFYEVHCLDPRLRNCHLGISVAESETAANHIRRSSAKFLVLASKGTWSGNAQNLTHQFVVNEAGKEYLVTNNPTVVVYSVVLRCIGVMDHEFVETSMEH